MSTLIPAKSAHTFGLATEPTWLRDGEPATGSTTLPSVAEEGILNRPLRELYLNDIFVSYLTNEVSSIAELSSADDNAIQAAQSINLVTVGVGAYTLNLPTAPALGEYVRYKHSAGIIDATASNKIIIEGKDGATGFQINGQNTLDMVANGFDVGFRFDGTSWGLVSTTGRDPLVTALKGTGGVAQTADFTATSGSSYPIDTSGGSFNVTLPSNPNDGDIIGFYDATSSFGTNKLNILRSVAPAGNVIKTIAADIKLTQDDQALKLIYVAANNNWAQYDDAGALGGLTKVQTTAETGNFTALSKVTYPIDTSGGVITATLPAVPSAGDVVGFYDATSSFGTNNLTIARNGNNIKGTASDLVLEVDDQAIHLIFQGGNWAPLNDAGDNANVTTKDLTAKSGAFTADDNTSYKMDTSGGAVTVTLPAAPVDGSVVKFYDLKSSFGANNLTIARNGNTIKNAASDLVISNNDAAIALIYDTTTTNWSVYDDAGLSAGGTAWVATPLTGSSTAISGSGYFVDTSGAVADCNLPAAPAAGDEVTFIDMKGNFDTNSFTVNQNGNNIMGLAQDLLMEFKNQAITLVYSGNATDGWRVKSGTHTGGVAAYAGGSINNAPSAGTHTPDFTGDVKTYRTTLTSNTTVNAPLYTVGKATSFYMVIDAGAGGFSLTLPVAWLLQGGTLDLSAGKKNVIHGFYDGTDTFYTITVS